MLSDLNMNHGYDEATAIKTISRAVDKGKYLLILHKTVCCDPSSEPSR